MIVATEMTDSVIHSFSHWAIMTRAMERADSERHSFSHWAIMTRATERTDSEVHSFSHWAIMIRARERTESEIHSFSHRAIITDIKEKKTAANMTCYILFSFLVHNEPLAAVRMTNYRSRVSACFYWLIITFSRWDWGRNGRRFPYIQPMWSQNRMNLVSKHQANGVSGGVSDASQGSLGGRGWVFSWCWKHWVHSVSSWFKFGFNRCVCALVTEIRKKFRSRASEHMVVVRERSWVQGGLWSDQNCPLSTLTQRLESNNCLRFVILS